MHEYHEKAEAIYKKIRNRIRACNIDDSLINIVPILRKLDSISPEKYNGYCPWHILYLVKMILMYGEENQTIKPLDHNSFANCINSLVETTAYSPFLKNFSKIMRIMAFQQYYFQNPLNMYDIARNLILFANYHDNSSISQIFITDHGYKIRDFLMLSFCLWNITEKEVVTFSCDSFIKNTDFSREIVLKYLHSISLTKQEAKRFLKEEKKKPIEYDIYEPSPLIKYPLLRLSDNEYLLYSRKVFVEAFRTHLFDFVKRNGGDKGGALFRDNFEAYVGKGLNLVLNKVIPENKLPKDMNKKVDFIIPLSSCNILVEAKAIDFTYKEKVTPYNNYLVGNLKESVIKGVRQAYETARYMEEHKIMGVSSSCNFVLIVTYGQLYLGKDAWNEFIDESIRASLKDEYNDLLRVIPPSRIFVISIKLNL